MSNPTIYEAVSVEKELPKESGGYLCINPKIKLPFEVRYNAEAGTFELGAMSFFVRTSGITHWLRPLPNHVAISVERLDALEKCVEAMKKVRRKLNWVENENELEIITQALQHLSTIK